MSIPHILHGASEQEYLVAVRRDSAIKSSLFHDFKDILNRFSPDWALGWDAELDLGSKLLYEGICIWTGKNTIGQDLASIEPVNIDATNNLLLQRARSRFYHNSIWYPSQIPNQSGTRPQQPHQSRQPKPKSASTPNTRLQSTTTNPPTQHSSTPITATTTDTTNTTTPTTTTINAPNTPNTPTAQQHQPPQQSRQHPSTTNPLKALLQRLPFQKPREYRFSTRRSTMQNRSNRPQSEIEAETRLELISQDILSQKPLPLVSPIVASLEDKVKLSFLHNIPSYLITKLSSTLESQHIPSDAPILTKCWIWFRNTFFVSLIQKLAFLYELLHPLDFICLCLLSDWFCLPEKLLGITYCHTPSSALKGQEMKVERAAFFLLGIVLGLKFFFTTFPTVLSSTSSLIRTITRWLKVKALLVSILTTRFIRSTLSKVGLMKPGPGSTSTTSTSLNNQQQSQDQTQLTQNTESLSNNIKIYTNYQSQLTPHQRHLLRKKLFRYQYELSSVQCGNFYKDDDIFEYYHHHTQGITHISAYDMAVSSGTEGAWDTSASESDTNPEEKKSDDYPNMSYIDPFGTSSDSNDHGLSGKMVKYGNIDDIELYIKNGRQNKQLYLHLIAPLSTQTTQTQSIDTIPDNANHNVDQFDRGGDDEDDDDDGVLYLGNRPGGGYMTKAELSQQESLSQQPRQQRQSQFDDYDDDDDYDDEDNDTDSDQDTIAVSHNQSVSIAGQSQRVVPVALMKSSCGVCLCKAKATTATTCGHIFCWSCILGYAQVKRECPTCRTACSPSELLRLFQFG